MRDVVDMQVGASWPAAFEQDCFGFAEEAFDQQWRRRSPLAERQVAAATACPVGGLPIRRGPDQIDGGRGQCVADDPRGGLLPDSVGRLESRQPSEGRRAWRLYAPIASPSWPAPGLGGCAARGRPWWCHGPGRGACRNGHSGRGAEASTREY